MSLFRNTLLNVNTNARLRIPPNGNHLNPHPVSLSHDLKNCEKDQCLI